MLLGWRAHCIPVSGRVIRCEWQHSAGACALLGGILWARWHGRAQVSSQWRARSCTWRGDRHLPARRHAMQPGPNKSKGEAREERCLSVTSHSPAADFLYMRHSANVNNHRRAPHYSPGRCVISCMRCGKIMISVPPRGKSCETWDNDTRRKYPVPNGAEWFSNLICAKVFLLGRQMRFFRAWATSVESALLTSEKAVMQCMETSREITFQIFMQAKQLAALGKRGWGR